jgi:hypothetical protein
MSAFPPDLARRIAQRLAEETDPNLPALTQRVLAEGPETSTKPQSYDAGTAIALAALLLTVAQFAWSVYRDLKKDQQEAEEKPAVASPRELLYRRLRLEFHDRPGVSPTQRDRLFEVVVDEVLLRDGAAPRR